MSEKATLTEQQIWDFLSEVPDPEIPVLSILDLGMVREVKINEAAVEVVITPTYSGCPATVAIELDVKAKLAEKGLENFSVIKTLSPAWTTEWITAEGRRKLETYGIAPPNPMNDPDRIISCPQCKSKETEVISEFGSTPCKSLYRCLDCRESFDYFKCH